MPPPLITYGHLGPRGRSAHPQSFRRSDSRFEKTGTQAELKCQRGSQSRKISIAELDVHGLASQVFRRHLVVAQATQFGSEPVTDWDRGYSLELGDLLYSNEFLTIAGCSMSSRFLRLAKSKVKDRKVLIKEASVQRRYCWAMKRSLGAIQRGF